MAQVEVKVKLDLPPGVELLGYERSGDGHGFEVIFPCKAGRRSVSLRNSMTKSGHIGENVFCSAFVNLFHRLSRSRSRPRKRDARYGVRPLHDQCCALMRGEGTNRPQLNPKADAKFGLTKTVLRTPEMA